MKFKAPKKNQHRRDGQQSLTKQDKAQKCTQNIPVGQNGQVRNIKQDAYIRQNRS